MNVMVWKVDLIHSLLESPEHLITLLDKEGRIKYFSPPCERLSGYSELEVLNKPFWDVFLPPEIRSEVKERFFNNIIAKDITSYNRELPIVTKEGKIHIIAFHVTPTRDANGDIMYIAYGVDVTEEHTTKEELERVVYTMKEIIEKVPVGMYIVNSSGRVEYVNPSMLEICGDSPEQFLGINCLQLPTYIEYGIAEKIREGLKGKPFKIGPMEYTSYYGKKKTYRTFTGIPIKDRSGENKLLVVVQDLTEIKKAETVRDEKNLLDNIVNIAGTIIIILDIGGKIVRFNKIASTILGICEDEVIGKDFWEVIYSMGGKAKRRISYRNRFPSQFETYLTTNTGIERLISWKVTYLKDLQGMPRLVVCAGVDITEERKAKEALEHAFMNFAKSISHAIASTDPYTANHQKRVADLAYKVGKMLGLNEERLKGLYIGALLHDIGKIGIPEIILIKPGMLSSEEWNLVKTHTKIGYEILEDAKLPWPVAKMALYHHERLDGSGYPEGLKGNKILLETRILGVCDVVEAMSSHRPYRPSRGQDQVVEEILNGKGIKYDPDVCEIILEIIESGKFEIGEKSWIYYEQNRYV